MEQLRVGVDIGSTTIKLVVVDETENILYSIPPISKALL